MSTATTPGTNTELIDVAPDLLEQWAKQGDTVIVDVREDFEHAEERIDGAELMPLSKFDAAALRARHGGHKVVFQCRSGRRSADAAGRYAAAGEKVFHLAGGIEAWKASGRPVIKPKKANRIPVMRQVQIVAGSLVAVGVALGAFVHPAFLVLPGFVGCGLVFAGISGWCGMAMLLGKMPWNKVGSAS